MNKDRLITGISKNGEIRIYFAQTTAITEEIRRIFDASPMSTMILGRLAAATVIMGAMSKIDKEELTVQIKGGADMKLAIAVADTKGNVKVSSKYTKLKSRYNTDGALDIARAIGKDGKMFVIKDFGVGEPFIGQVDLVSGEITEDFTHYFAQSEQIATAVGLGVMLNPKEAKVDQAGGFIVQVLPGASHETLDYLEKQILRYGSVTELLKQDMSIKEIANLIMGELGLKELESMPITYKCSCSKDKVLGAFYKLGKAELASIMREEGKAEAVCDFCNKIYNITNEELATQIAKYNLSN